MSISNNMIDSGVWVYDKQPKIDVKEFDVVFRFGFQFKEFRFLCEIMTKKENANDFIFFIKPYVKNFNNHTIVISDVIKPSIYYQRDIYNITIPNEKIQNILRDFRESKIFFSDDITGTEFKQCIDFSIKR